MKVKATQGKAIQIGETNNLPLLKKMRDAAQNHVLRCLNKEDDEYNLDRAADLQIDLLAVKLRIEELEGILHGNK